MRNFLSILLILLSINVQSQISEKLEISYEWVELYVDTVSIGEIKTHTNFDFINSGVYMYWSTGSERLYHFIHPESSAYDVNRISYSYDILLKKYISDFKIFEGEISIKFTENYKELKLTKDKYSILFYNY